MKITETLKVSNRAAWRAWLAKYHQDKTEIWLLHNQTQPTLTYLESVLEAMCYGWIDGIAKRHDEAHLAQRFTPRRQKSHWTELNKERARGLIAQNLMTEAGSAVLPDLSVEAFKIAEDIQNTLKTNPETWANFQAFSALYQRIRIGYIEEVRRQPEVFKKRLEHFVKQTNRNKMFGTLE